MLKNIKKITARLAIFSVIFLLGMSLAQYSHASTAQEDLTKQLNLSGGSGYGGAGSPTSMTLIVQYAIRAFLGLLGIIFLVLIIYAGFEWMTAQGDEDKVTKAKDTLQRAVIGLIIIIAAYAITYFVFSSLSGLEGAPPPNPLQGT